MQVIDTATNTIVAEDPRRQPPVEHGADAGWDEALRRLRPVQRGRGDRHTHQQEDRGNPGYAALGRRHSLTARAEAIATPTPLRNLAALAPAPHRGIYPRRADAAGRTVRNPSPFDTPLQYPAATADGAPRAADAQWSCAPYHGSDGALAFAARSDGRDYVDPTLVVRTGERVRSLEKQPATDGGPLAWPHDGHRQRRQRRHLIEPGKSFDYALSPQPRRSTGITRIRMAPRPRRPTADCSGSSPSRMTTNRKLRAALSSCRERQRFRAGVAGSPHAHSRHRYSAVQRGRSSSVGTATR